MVKLLPNRRGEIYDKIPVRVPNININNDNMTDYIIEFKGLKGEIRWYEVTKVEKLNLDVISVNNEYIKNIITIRRMLTKDTRFNDILYEGSYEECGKWCRINRLI